MAKKKRPRQNRRAAELIALIAFAVAALTAISLLSFDPLDRSFFTEPASTRGATQNLVGSVGANLSHSLLVGFGIFAYGLPFLLVLLGVRTLRGGNGLPNWSRAVSIGLLWLSVSALLAISVNTIEYEATDGIAISQVPVPAGGLVGQLTAAPLHRWLGSVGSLIALLTTFSAALVLTTPLSFARAMDQFGKNGTTFLKRSRTRGQKWFTRWNKQREKGRAKRLKQNEADRLKREDKARQIALEHTERVREEEIQGAARKAAAAVSRRGTSSSAPTPRPVDPQDEKRQKVAAAAAASLALAIPIPPTAGPTHVTEIRPDDLDSAEPLTDMAAQARGAIERARQTNGTSPVKPRAKTEKLAKNRRFDLPPLDLLEHVANNATLTEEELVEHAQTLVSKLGEFNVDGTVEGINPGPVVTTYEYRPKPGVKYSKIVGLADDLCLAMRAEGVRIDRISGKSAVGIEVPNSQREPISLRELIEHPDFTKAESVLTLALGKDITGQPAYTDLRKMPHLLVAGATGAGKSVAVNCMIVSILYRATPDQVRFIMVDPKRIELGIYDGIPHLLVPVVTDPRKASNALRWACAEMENRYKRLAMLGVRSLDQFNACVTGPEREKLAENMTEDELKPLPYIVILIDELADLMMIAANEVEDSISRLAAMARAVGIHLVLATQRPSVDVITGVIKANFPSRISFRVSTKVDSRTVLDANGAEMLLGKGDMLFMPPGTARLQRTHGGFVSDGEVQRLVNYLKNQAEPEYDDAILKDGEQKKESAGGVEVDEMYEEAIRVVLENGQASVSMLQRRLRLGYGRAARLVDMMELNGIVGPSQGAKGREILVDRQSYLEQMAAGASG